MKATNRKDLLVLIAMFGVAVLTGLWSVVRQPPAAPVNPEVAFSPQMRSLLDDILDKEHVRQLRLHRRFPTPDAMMDVDESVLLDRKYEIVRAASTRGDRALMELLTNLTKWEKDGETSRAQELQKDACRKRIERLLEQNGLGPAVLLPAR
jgi:hypothetical protein